MIIGVLKIGLQEVVIDILGRELDRDARQPQRQAPASLACQSHPAERLVDREADLHAYLHPALDEMAGDQLCARFLPIAPLLPISRSAGALPFGWWLFYGAGANAVIGHGAIATQGISVEQQLSCHSALDSRFCPGGS